MRRNKRNNRNLYIILAICVLLIIFAFALYDLSTDRATNITSDLGLVLGVIVAPVAALFALGIAVLNITSKFASKKISNDEKAGMLKRLVIFVAGVFLAVKLVDILNYIFTKIF